MTNTKKIPAYEALESKVDELDHLAALCARMFDGCIDAYLSERKMNTTDMISEDAPDPITIIDRLNHRVDSINQHLMSTKASGVRLENEIPMRISGKSTAPSGECSIG